MAASGLNGILKKRWQHPFVERIAVGARWRGPEYEPGTPSGYIFTAPTHHRRTHPGTRDRSVLCRGPRTRRPGRTAVPRAPTNFHDAARPRWCVRTGNDGDGGAPRSGNDRLLPAADGVAAS